MAQTESVGLRLGGGVAVCGEVVGRWTLKDNTFDRIEGSVGWLKEGHHVDQAVGAVCQWRGSMPDGFGWYAGIGARISWRLWGAGYGEPQLVPAVVVQAGLEYVFPRLPLAISLDIRPAFEVPDATLLAGNIALGVHYRL